MSNEIAKLDDNLYFPSYSSENIGYLITDLINIIASEIYSAISYLGLGNYESIVACSPHGELIAASLVKLHKKDLDIIKISREFKTENPETEKKVLLIDYTISTASSKKKIINRLEAHKIKTEAVLAFIGRENGGLEELQKAGYKAYAILAFSEILKTIAANTNKPNFRFFEAWLSLIRERKINTNSRILKSNLII